MAKKEMICPFSGAACKNCPIYIGRHYYLCDCTNYRGYVGQKKGTRKAVTQRLFSAKTKKNFKIPLVKSDALDPFDAGL